MTKNILNARPMSSTEDHVEFYDVVMKLKERLVIFEYNVLNGIATNEEDVAILKELHELWYTGKLDYLIRQRHQSLSATQLSLPTDSAS